MVEATVFTLTTRFTYDGDGARRVVEVVGHGTTTYTVDYAAGNRILAETTPTSTVTYLYGHDCLGEFRDDEPALSGAEGWLYYLNDGIGYVRQGADEQGEVVSSWLFDPDGTVLEGPEGLVSHLICGGVYDWSTGLIFKGGRYFDPSLGIWLALIPLVVIQSWRGRKRRRQGWPWYVVVLVVVGVGGVLAGCGKGTPTPEGDIPALEEECTYTPELPTPTPTPPTPIPPTPTPTPADCARITSEAIAQAGGLQSYLWGESDACTLTRVAMGESHENEADRELIMWIIKVRADLGYGNANSRGFNPPHDRWGEPTSIKQEALNPGQFLSVGVAYKIADPEGLPKTGNIRAMLNPTDAQLPAFQSTHQIALNIVDLPISSAPEELKGFDGFVADDTAVYWVGGKTSSELAGSNAYYDQSWLDNIHFGLISCENARDNNRNHPLMDLQCPATPTPSL